MIIGRRMARRITGEPIGVGRETGSYLPPERLWDPFGTDEAEHHEDRYHAQGKLDAGRPIDPEEGRVGLDPRLDLGETEAGQRLVAVMGRDGRRRLEILKPVQLPHVFYVAQAALGAVVDIEAIGLARPISAGRGVEMETRRPARAAPGLPEQAHPLGGRRARRI